METHAPYGATTSPEVDKLLQVIRFLRLDLDITTVGRLSNGNLKAFERTLHYWQQLTDQMVKARLAGQAVQFAEGQGHD